LPVTVVTVPTIRELCRSFSVPAYTWIFRTTWVGGWVPATDVPREDGTFNPGFVEVARISATQQLKVFYLDVGQGDATLIEAEDAIVIIDG
jgi:beta-lactamase superfamily II metal-dependent hydrolase